jgi:hypothetical protein
MIATGSAGIELVDLTGFAGCLARRDTSDATSLSWPVEPLPYNTDVIDTASYFNTSTGEITIPSGVSAVEVWAGVRTPDDALAGSNVLTIEKNGTTVPALRTHTRQGTTGTATNYAATVVPYLAVSNGDVLHARLAQTDLSTTESLLDDFGSIFGCRVIPSVFSPIATYTNAFLHTGRTWAAATTGWNGYTIRRVITQIDLLRGGSKFQLKVKGPTTAANTVIGSCYIGRRNEIYGFREAPTQITFNTGSSGVTLGQNAEVTSDEITYEINPREEYIISFYISGVSSISAITVSSTTGHGGAYYKAAVNEPTTQAPTGYTAATTNAYIISGLDVY